jgi:hypothetical protein
MESMTKEYMDLQKEMLQLQEDKKKEKRWVNHPLDRN